jgi:Arc/MetJ-type ribon-helix-helix transcriptional regulator
MAKMETLTVELPEELVAQVREAVAQKEFATSDEAVAAALAEWQERRDIPAEDVEFLKQAWKEAMDDPRPYQPMEEVMDRLEAKYSALVEQEAEREKCA